MVKIEAKKGCYFVVSMAASDSQDRSNFYTDEIDTEDRFDFWTIEDRFDSDGAKMDEEDCSGPISINPAQVVSVEEFNRNSEGSDAEAPEEEPESVDKSKYSNKSVDEIPQKKKKGWF